MASSGYQVPAGDRIEILRAENGYFITYYQFSFIAKTMKEVSKILNNIEKGKYNG